MLKFYIISSLIFPSLLWAQDIALPEIQNQKALRYLKESGYVDKSETLDKYKEVVFKCDSETLVPKDLHQQDKKYNYWKLGEYDHSKLRGDDYGCRMSSKYKNSRGFKHCLAPQILNDVIVSDLYMDTCGNTYRAFWHKRFFSAEESQETLVAPGKVMKWRKDNIGHKVYYIESLLPVKLSDFLFLAASKTN